MKICKNPNCDEINPQPVGNFYKRKDSKDGLTNTCKKCKDLHSVKYVNTSKGKESKNRANRKYKNSINGKFKTLKYQKIYEQTENSKIVQKRYSKTENFKTNQKKYRNSTNGRAKFNAYGAKRRASKNHATPSWLTKKQLGNIENMYRLAKLAEKYFGMPMHVDHIEPLRGKDICGLHVPWNLQVLPAFKNIKKGNKRNL